MVKNTVQKYNKITIHLFFKKEKKKKVKQIQNKNATNLQRSHRSGLIIIHHQYNQNKTHDHNTEGINRMMHLKPLWLLVKGEK